MIRTFDDMRKAMLYHRIVAWKGNTIVLDNGMRLTIGYNRFSARC